MDRPSEPENPKEQPEANTSSKLPEHPAGTVQAICSSAIGLLALLIAFIGYTAFNSKSAGSPWRYEDRYYLILALVAAATLVSTPWLATSHFPIKARSPIELARWLFAFGAFLSITAIAYFFFQDYASNQIENVQEVTLSQRDRQCKKLGNINVEAPIDPDNYSKARDKAIVETSNKNGNAIFLTLRSFDWKKGEVITAEALRCKF